MATVTYPGVYIEEIPSGVRTIVGVSTSTTAFVGRALKGPVETPTQITSFGEYDSIFGGLGDLSPMSFAVQQYFLNGGQVAVIVRLVAGAAAAAHFQIPGAAGNLMLDASSPGTWGGNLRIEIDTANVSSPGLFNIIVSDPGPPVGTGKGGSEVIRNVSATTGSPRFVTQVLEQQSQFLRVAPSTTVRLPFGTRGTRTTLNGAITAGATTINVHAGDGALFPTTFPYILAIESEVVQVTARATDAFTVTRAANGTTAAAHADGTVVELLPMPPIAATSGGNDGSALGPGDVNHAAGPSGKHGMYALEDQDIFNILVIPPLAFGTDVPVGVSAAAATYCRQRRAFLIIDSPDGTVVAPATTAKAGFDALAASLSPGTLDAQYAGYFFPRFNAINPLTGRSQEFAASGAIAGVFARTDASRGVWKAPAGLEAGLNGILELAYNVTDGENGVLNQAGVNCLRTFNLMGSPVWGSRTVQGSDAQASDWKYIPVRRVALYIEESLFRGTQWVVFEPNDEPLWAQIRLAIGAFMQNLFRQGAFQGRTPREAYFVKCDSETTTQNDINLGIVNILVGFAPLKPAEFVIIKIQQMAGQVQV
jgi:uncharacterized protein